MSQQQFAMQYCIPNNSMPQHIYMHNNGNIPQQQIRLHANYYQSSPRNPIQFQPQIPNSYPPQRTTINKYHPLAPVDKYSVYNASIYRPVPISYHPPTNLNLTQQIMPLTQNITSLPPNNTNIMPQRNQFQPQINKHQTAVYNDHETKQTIDAEEIEEIDDDHSDTDFYSDASNEDENNINDLFIEGEAILVGEYIGIIRYLGPLYMNPGNELEITKEDYIGIECVTETDTNGRGHDGFYKGHRYFKTKHNKKTGILIKAAKFKQRLSPFMLLENIKKQSDAMKQLRKTIATLKTRNELLSVNVESLLLQQHRIKKLFNKYGLLKHRKLNDINDETLLNLMATKSRSSNTKHVKKQKNSLRNRQKIKKNHHDLNRKKVAYIDDENKNKSKHNNNENKYIKNRSKLEMKHKTINLASASIAKQKHHKIEDDKRILKSYDDYHPKDTMKQSQTEKKLRLLNQSSNDDISESKRNSMFRTSMNSDINKYNIGNERKFSSITVDSIEYNNEKETPLLLDDDSVSSQSSNDNNVGTVHYIPHSIQTSVQHYSDGESMEWTEGSSDDDGSGIWALGNRVRESSDNNNDDIDNDI